MIIFKISKDMTKNITEYITISYFIWFSFALALILLVAVYLLSYTSKIEGETSSGYECGFQSFSETHFPFSIQYSLIAIVFLLFDIEVWYLYPLCTSILSLNFLELCLFLLFFIIVIAGLCFEISRSLLTFSLKNDWYFY